MVQVVGLILLVALVRTAARRVGLQAPILLLVVGVAGSFVPGVPAYDLDPEIMLVAVLPLLLYAAAFNTSFPAFRANAGPIVSLSVGLTLFTTVVVGFVASAVIPGLGLAGGMVLGAVVAPPDAVAATAVGRQVGMPRRVLTLLEGESLFNDAAALTAYGVAVAAVVGGSFSLLSAAGQFLIASLGGLAIGGVVAVVAARVRARIDSAVSDVTLSLVAPFAAYFPAEEMHASGLVATVVVGLYLGHRSPTLMNPPSRVLSASVWRVIQYLFEGAVFVLMGMRLPDIIAGLGGYSLGLLAGSSAVVIATVVVSRFAWVFPTAYLPPLVSRRIRAREPPAPPWQVLTLVSWAGMRGVVSLAAALALPLTVSGGAPFPQRALLVFLTFVVIVATLIGQGTTLPAVVRRLPLPPAWHPAQEAQREADQEAEARYAAATAALGRLDELTADGSTRPEVADQLRKRAENRQLAAREHQDDRIDTQGREAPSQAYHRLARAMIAAERNQLLQMRAGGQLSEDAFQRVQKELDLEESTL